jgi:type I restriction enzyme R subunit
MTELAIDIDTVVRLTKPDSWIGNPFEERMVKRAIAKALPTDFDRLDKLFNLVKAP